MGVEVNNNQEMWEEERMDEGREGKKGREGWRKGGRE